MVWRSLSDIAFSDAKQLLVGCREPPGKKDTEFKLKVSHSFKTAKWNKKNYCCFKVLKKGFFWENWQKCSIQFSVSQKFLKFLFVSA